MDLLSPLWDYVVPFLVILTVLVFVHELGHYWVARRNGVRIEVFSIGFGKEIWGWNDQLGTRWRLSLIPVGGYVRFFGEPGAEGSIDESLKQMAPEERAVAFHSKTVGQRFAIVVAGPAANFLFAFILLVGLYMTVGQPFTPAEVMNVMPGSAAEESGIRTGDRIVRIDGDEIERFEELRSIIGLSAGRTLTIVVIRDGVEIALQVTPRLTEVTDSFGNTQMIGQLGVARVGTEFRRLGPLGASWSAIKQTSAIIGLTVNALGQIITGSRSLRELSGPVKIAQMSGKVAEFGVVNVIGFMILLSINLGLINLFPIPILDGGHLMFYAIEAIRGKPVGERAQDYGNRIGLAFVLTLMIVVTWNDLTQLKFFEFLSRLFS